MIANEVEGEMAQKQNMKYRIYNWEKINLNEKVSSSYKL